MTIALPPHLTGPEIFRLVHLGRNRFRNPDKMLMATKRLKTQDSKDGKAMLGSIC